MQTVSLLIIGSESERRRQIKQWLKRKKGITLVGEISEMNGLRLVPRLAPDVVIYDGASPTLNPMVVLPALHEQPYPPQTLVLLAGTSPIEARMAQNLGAAATTTLHTGDSDVQLERVLQRARAAVRALPEPTWLDLLG